MPNASTTQNNFTKGLITESTGLNFPENAATFANNTEFTLVGDVIRREGINLEANGVTFVAATTTVAQSSYVWDTPGGDSNSKLLVEQIGNTLYFYNIAVSTTASPLSTHKLAGTVLISNAVAGGSTFDATKECTYADGNGYLFVYHPSCDPFYVSYDATFLALAPTIIPIQIRDFQGAADSLPVNTRPSTLSSPHAYNLYNQGWVQGNSSWSATSTTPYTFETAGLVTWVVQTGLPISAGTPAQVIYTGPGQWGFPDPGQQVAAGIINSYAAGTGVLVIDVTIVLPSTLPGPGTSFAIVPNGPTGMINTFQAAANVYPSNSDIWYTFKDATNTFNPAATLTSQTLTTGQAPQGHFVLPAFNMDRAAAAGAGLNLNAVATTARPTNGAWYAGRVWYTGVSGFRTAEADEFFYTWTENIYFSQVVSGVSDFGSCYQINDPTSDQLNGLLPTDGGVITIVGSGTIHKLFPIANGLIVFANNGVWFITGSQGIGFSANDYTITKLSNIKTLSNKSFVNVMGLPYFWNEEGIYQVTPSQGGQLTVEPITVGTILTFFNNIPLASKKFARGDYDPINYVIQWVYRSEMESGIGNRYSFDSILNYNVYNKAFFPYSIDNTGTHISSINYVNYPYISNATPEPGFKYISGNGTFIGFAEEYDTTYVDWGNINYVSEFITGFAVHGGGQKRFQIPYLYVFSRSDTNTAYKIQSLWDYAISGNSGRYSSIQVITNDQPNVGMVFRRHRLRGQGLTLQIRFASVDGQPFDIVGWSSYENINTSV